MRGAIAQRTVFVFAVVTASLLGSSGTALSQASVSIYGGYNFQDGPSAIGHGYSLGGSFVDREMNIKDSLFTGISLRTAPGTGFFAQHEFYLEWVKGSGRVSDPAVGGSAAYVTEVDGGGQIGTNQPGVSELSRSRFEGGIRSGLPVSGFNAPRYFVNAFGGVARDKVGIAVSVYTSDGRTEWLYGGVEFGVEKSIPLQQNLSLLIGGSLGGYWGSSEANFENRFMGTTIYASQTDSSGRGGARAQLKAELVSNWSPGVSGSLYAHGIYWSDVPFSAMPTNVGTPVPAHIGYAELFEYRVGVKLTATIGAKP